jgi:hypothetical protein
MLACDVVISFVSSFNNFKHDFSYQSERQDSKLNQVEARDLLMIPSKLSLVVAEFASKPECFITSPQNTI